MKIHEYQGKALLAQYGVPVPKGKVAYTADEAVEAAKGLGFPVVVKAQIHAGGRGKGGGVKLAKTVDDCESIAKSILGMRLRTHRFHCSGICEYSRPRSVCQPIQAQSTAHFVRRADQAQPTRT